MIINFYVYISFAKAVGLERNVPPIRISRVRFIPEVLTNGAYTSGTGFMTKILEEHVLLHLSNPVKRDTCVEIFHLVFLSGTNLNDCQ